MRMRETPQAIPGRFKGSKWLVGAGLLVVLFGVTFVMKPGQTPMVTTPTKPPEERQAPPAQPSRLLETMDRMYTATAPQVVEATPVLNGTTEPEPSVMKEILAQLKALQTSQDLMVQVLGEMRQERAAVVAPAGQPPKPPPVDKKRLAEEAKREREDAERQAKAWKAPLWKADAQKSAYGRVHHPSPYSLSPTTLIHCQMITETSNETPGDFEAMVTVNIKDSATLTHTVIPQTSIMKGKLAGQTILGDERLSLELTHLKFPKGEWMELRGAKLNDAEGKSGLTGDVDRHWGRLLASVVVQGVLRGGTSVMAGGYSGETSERIAGAVAAETAMQGSQQARQVLRTEPTITIEAGAPCVIMLDAPLELAHAYQP